MAGLVCETEICVAAVIATSFLIGVTFLAAHKNARQISLKTKKFERNA